MPRKPCSRCRTPRFRNGSRRTANRPRRTPTGADRSGKSDLLFPPSASLPLSPLSLSERLPARFLPRWNFCIRLPIRRLAGEFLVRQALPGNLSHTRDETVGVVHFRAVVVAECLLIDVAEKV